MSVVRLVIVSDIHSNLEALEAVVAHFPAYDELLCLGDLVGYGPQPSEVVARLRDLRPTVVLMGNHDYAVATGDTEGFSPNAARAVEWTRGRIREGHRQYLASLKLTSKLVRGGSR